MHSTLPLVTVGTMVYAFVEFYRGGGELSFDNDNVGGGVDRPEFAAIVLGLWAVGKAPS
jgi:hypothetical protein